MKKLVCRCPTQDQCCRLCRVDTCRHARHVVGDIDQLGDGVTGFDLGDRVADMTVIGSNAAYRTLRADRLTRVPPGLDPAEAATLILSWTTAYQLLHRAARVRQGQRVLVQGAAGPVG